MTTALAQARNIGLHWFVYLQILDVATTLIGLRLGGEEASPFIRSLMQHSTPVIGVLTSKMIALALAAACIWLHRSYVIRRINCFYAALIVWNLWMIIQLQAAGVST